MEEELVWLVGSVFGKASSAVTLHEITRWMNPFSIPLRWTPRLVWSALMTFAKKQKRQAMHEQAIRQGGDGAPCFTLQVLYLFMRSWYLRSSCSVRAQRRNFRDLMKLFRPYPYPDLIRKIRMRPLTTPQKINMFLFLPPTQATGVVFYVHGGGAILGNAHEEYVHVLRMICDRSNSHVYALHFPKSPKQLFPLALDACLEGYRFLAKQHNPKDIVIAGDDMGANIVLCALTLLRDSGETLPAACYLFAPIDLPRNPPHLSRHASDHMPQSSVQFIRGKYFGSALPDHCEEFEKLYRKSLCEIDLHSLPSTCIVTSTDDFFLHDSLSLARHMRNCRHNAGETSSDDDNASENEPSSSFDPKTSTIDIGQTAGSHNLGTLSGVFGGDEEVVRTVATDDDDDDDDDDKIFSASSASKLKTKSTNNTATNPLLGSKPAKSDQQPTTPQPFVWSPTHQSHIEVFVWKNLPHTWFLFPIFKESVTFFEWFGHRVRCDVGTAPSHQTGSVPGSMIVKRGRYVNDGLFWASKDQVQSAFSHNSSLKPNTKAKLRTLYS